MNDTTPPPDLLDEVLQGHLADMAPEAALALRETLCAIARACARISEAAALGMLAGMPRTPGTQRMADTAHGQVEHPQRLDEIAGALMASSLSGCAHVAAWASEEREPPHVSQAHGVRGSHLVVFDPLDGSSNREANIASGTIFSVLPHRYRGMAPGEADFMQPGHQQLAAGYVLYGPATLMVLTCRRGVLVFALDRRGERGAGQGAVPQWVLTHQQVRIPAHTQEFAINSSNQRFWEKPVQRYVAECVAGDSGPRMKDFNMRWVASMVAEVHRIMTRGGVFLYPRDTREPRKPGRLRLMAEAAPMALLVAQAGGRATNGTSDLLDLVPDTLHHRVPVILGSKDEIDRIVGYHADPSENVSWQLFKTRSLFVQPQA